MEGYRLQTDLALEVRESFPGDGGEIPGVSLEVETEGCARVSRVEIFDEEGERTMGKAQGTYLTLEFAADDLMTVREEAVSCLAKHLVDLLEAVLPQKRGSVLAVGLGNGQLVADALGPRTVAGLKINRKIGGTRGWTVSGIAPGVMARTGMETAEILRGIVRETKPDCLVAVDALAARSVARLGRTIQLTDTGIRPGAGIGNYRTCLSKETLGVPVLAVGVPTVVSATTIVYDTMEALVETLRREMTGSGMAEAVEAMSREEKYRLIHEVWEPRFGPLFVTLKNMDERVEALGRVLSEGMNRAFRA